MPLVILSIFLMTLAVAGTFYLAYLRKIHPLGLPLLAGAIFFFVYVIQPAYLIWTGDIYYFLNNWQITKGVFVAFIMYLAFLKGWFSGIKKKIKTNNNIIEKWNYCKLYRVGLGLSIFGTLLFLIFIYQSGGIYTFYSLPHGAAGAWREQTAYVYMGKRLIFPGLILMIISCVRLNRPFRKWLPVLFFSLLCLSDAILSSLRGEFFILTVTLALSYFFTGGKMPRVRYIILGGIIIGISILLIVGYREHTHIGPKEKLAPNFKEALLSMLNIGESNLGARTTGIEFIYHAGIIDAVDKLKKYHLGLNWFYSVTIHLIPRIIWESKPYGFKTPGVYPEDMALLFGWIRAGGSAPSIVGDIYWQFGWGAIIFFYFLGFFSSYLFKKLYTFNNPLWILTYVLWYAWGINLFGQGFGAVIVPYLYALLPAVLLSKLCYKRFKRTNDKFAYNFQQAYIPA